MPIRETPWPAGTPCWVDCQVDEPARAADFYSTLFGWEITDSGPDGGGYLMAFRDGRPAAGIGPKPPGQAVPSVWTTYIASDDADSTAEAVAATGGTVLAAPFDVMDAGRMLVATDPTGAAFGVWESRRHHGAGIYNEHGAYCWNELHTAGYQQAQDFYSKVFGWSFAEIGDADEIVYATFASAPGGEPLGGLSDTTKTPGSGPPYWLSWFQVADTEAALSTATARGAAVVMGPDESPVGRMCVLTGPQGEIFGVIDVSKAAGSPS
ncbi:VOC family protein [Nocardia sp. X0981]